VSTFSLTRVLLFRRPNAATGVGWWYYANPSVTHATAIKLNTIRANTTIHDAPNPTPPCDIIDRQLLAAGRDEPRRGQPPRINHCTEHVPVLKPPLGCWSDHAAYACPSDPAPTGHLPPPASRFNFHQMFYPARAFGSSSGRSFYLAEPLGVRLHQVSLPGQSLLRSGPVRSLYLPGAFQHPAQTQPWSIYLASLRDRAPIWLPDKSRLFPISGEILF